MPRKSSTNAQLLAENLRQLAEDVTTLAIEAAELKIKTKPVEQLTLSTADLELIVSIPTIPTSLRKKLVIDDVRCTVADVARITKEIAATAVDAPLPSQVGFLRTGKHLVGQLKKQLATARKTSQSKSPGRAAMTIDAGVVYQFKITLIGSSPPIWRRIQVEDCTLDKFHEHIQTAMGWTNCHLHQFLIANRYYADPELFQEQFVPDVCHDSTETKISQLTSTVRKGFSFVYEYDFGDSWEHKIVFEGTRAKESGKKYPRCVKGDWACPPEDVGGIYGYYNFLDAREDENHPDHEDFSEWYDDFDPLEFDAEQATKRMKKGLPDWRD